MNHWSASPITQTNEVAGQYTPKEDDSPQVKSQSGREGRDHFLAEDLQKIRRSNHSSDRDRVETEDAMDDDEHDGVIKDLLYPGLETSNDLDFFEEDYNMAQSAVRRTADTQTPSSSFAGSTDNHAIHRRTGVNFLDDMDEEDDSYYASYYSSMGRPYSDLSNQKLRR